MNKFLRTIIQVFALVVALLPTAMAQGQPVLPAQPLPEAQERRAIELAKQLRCPVCKGTAINASPATIAQQMYGELRRQVQLGASDDEVLRFFSDRYGETVLLNPPKQGINLIIWLGPLLVVVAGGGVLLLYLRNASQTPLPVASADELAHARAELAARAAGQSLNDQSIEQSREQPSKQGAS
jgi:cytochrome c-type biogenesis protein CcmH